MKILQTFVATSGDVETQGTIFKMDTIEHEGKLWLVPQWLENREEGWMTPARIILLDVLQHEDIRDSKLPADYNLNYPIPKAVLDGKTEEQSATEYVVVELPGIKVPIPPSVH